jgi:hypothetical protein
MRQFIGALLVIALIGCAIVPDVTFTYYPATWESTITVTQTVACTEKKDRLVALSSVAVTTKYASDLSSTPRPLKVRDLSGPFGDSDITMTFAEDGRLKGINQSSTGQGDAIIKAAIAVGAAMYTIAAKDIRTPVAPMPPSCDVIEKWGSGKPVTLYYKKAVGPADIGTLVTLDIAPESEGLYTDIAVALPKPTSTISSASALQSGGRRSSDTRPSSDTVLLKLQDIGIVTVSTVALGKPLGEASVIIPQEGTYELPIPKPALFGKQTFAIALNDSGAVSTLSYGKIDGSASALSSLSALASAQTTGENARLADLKARADLMAQQQRIVLCESKPDQCK